MASTSVMSGGVAKKIALFEFTIPDTQNTNPNAPTRLRRKDAIKRKKSKSSHPTMMMTTSSNSDPETTAKLPSECFKTTRTLWLTSGGESSDSYGSSMGSSSGNTSTGIMKTKPSYSITTTSSSDDYEVNEFNSISNKMRENIALVDEMINNKNNHINHANNPRRNSFDNTQAKFEKHLKNRNTRSLREGYYQSFTRPLVKGGNLKLVEFHDTHLTSHSDGDLTEDEPFYEELDNYYNKVGGGIETQSQTDRLLWSLKPEELSISLGSKKDEETAPGRLQQPPTPPPYESLYSELIYGHGNNSNGNNNRRGSIKSSSSYMTPNSSLYNQSTSSTTTTTATTNPPPTTDPIYLNQFDLTKNKNPVLISQGSSLPSYYNNRANQSRPLPNVNNVTSSGSGSSGSNSNSSSSISIAKIAGNKLSKKFKFLRKLSKSSLDSWDVVSANQGLQENIETTDSGSQQQQPRRCSSSNGNINDHVAIKKLSISRPNIPPPEPPRNPPMAVNLNIKESPTQIPTPISFKIGGHDEDYNDDDSDFYDSDSELIRNFVAAVQPIYSMEEEPLYQYYTYGISLKPEDNYQPVIPKNLGLTLDMLIPRTGQRTLWCEIPEVQTSGILGILSDQQKKLQEAIFEVLTSEVSYLKSLNVLVSLFYDNNILAHVLTPDDRAILFGNITEVKDCSQSFLSELLNKWEESWYIQEVGQIIQSNASHKFLVYKEYCRNKPYQDKILQKLRNTSDEFVNIIKSIEEDPKCQMLRMDSFLMLPMQRITRLPLLVNAIIQRTQSLKEKSICEDALRSLTDLVLECNESARESQDAEETAAIFEKIEFPKNISSITYPGQFLLKGDFVRNPVDQPGLGKNPKVNWSFQKKKPTLYWLILFTNQLFITRKRSSGKFEVMDMIAPSESTIKPLPNFDSPSKDFQHFFMLHSSKHDIVYVLAARTQSEIDRWKQKLDQLKSHKNLKVEAIFLYDAKREDELSFTVGDIIKVSQIQPDGWYFGRKINTDESGWFPGNYCAEC